jgi:hypothetical protein
VGNETPTQIPPKLIMKIGLIAHQYDHVISSAVSVASSYMLISTEDEQTEECDATA